MTVTSHRIGALAAASTVIIFGGMETHSVSTIICYTIGAVTGSLLPDADTPYSRMGRRYLCILWPFYLLQYMIHLFAPRSFMDKTVKHRGVLHSPLVWICMIGILIYTIRQTHYQIPFLLSVGILIGVASHLFLDFISGGIPLFSPFIPKKYGTIIHIKTGGVTEQIVCLIMVVYCAFLWFCFFTGKFTTVK